MSNENIDALRHALDEVTASVPPRAFHSMKIVRDYVQHQINQHGTPAHWHLPPASPDNHATTSQRNYLVRLLCRVDLLAGPLNRNDYTGPQWLRVFQVCRLQEPPAGEWPTVQTWLDGITVEQASATIIHLLDQLDKQ